MLREDKGSRSTIVGMQGGCCAETLPERQEVRFYHVNADLCFSPHESQLFQTSAAGFWPPYLFSIGCSTGGIRGGGVLLRAVGRFGGDDSLYLRRPHPTGPRGVVAGSGSQTCLRPDDSREGPSSVT